MISKVTGTKYVAISPSILAHSVSIAVLLKAGKLVKSLEYFNLQSIKWKDFKDVEVLLKWRVMRRVHFETHLKLPQVIIH